MRTFGFISLAILSIFVISACNKSETSGSVAGSSAASGSQAGTSSSSSGSSSASTSSSSSTTGSSAGTTAPVPVGNSKNKVMVSALTDASLSPAQLDYLVALQNKLTTGWRPLASDHRYSVSVSFALTRPGLCTDIQPLTATGGQRAIERTMDSVRSCSPFPAVPAEFKETPTLFRCDFVYFPDK
jgi:hypothetical protein